MLAEQAGDAAEVPEHNTSPPLRDDGLNRSVVKFFWQQLAEPSDPEEWKGRDGVIVRIRRRMGAGAPSREACVK